MTWKPSRGLPCNQPATVAASRSSCFRHDDLLESADPSLDRGGAVLEGLVVEGEDLFAMLAADLVG